MNWHFGCQRSLIHSWWLRWRGNSVTLTLRKLRKPVQRMECTCHGSRKPKLKRRHGLVSSGIGVPFPPWMGVLSATTTPMPPISTTHLEDGKAHGHCSCTLSLETKDADTTSTLTCCLWVVTVSLYVDDSVSFISLQAYRGGKEKSAVETFQVQKDNVGRKSTAFATTHDQFSTNKYGGERITS